VAGILECQGNPTDGANPVLPGAGWNHSRASPLLPERDYGTQYTLHAEWGYDAVPDEVQEAAMLLANDYASHEVGYRDRYLQILKIQQDSLTYHNAAFRGTGNARVDLLLGGFRRQNGMIVL
jgi:hypothetical protein